MRTKNVEGLIHEIERFRLHDGPGIRTMVSLKGCSLRCEWCANPETQNPKPQLAFYSEKCVYCLDCVERCPIGIHFKETGKIKWDDCEQCFNCVEDCSYGAREFIGEYKNVDEVFDIVKRDRTFYNNSGGGLTISGGEPLAQFEFTRELLKKAKAENIHTAVDTTGYVEWEKIKGVLDFIDLLLFDIKHLDSDKHKEKTGVGNELILENAVKAAEKVKEMIVRVPLIPDYNDSLKHIKNLAKFVKEELKDVNKVDLLPYHTIGVSKAAQIGMEYRFIGRNELEEGKVDKIKQILRFQGLDVSIS